MGREVNLQTFAQLLYSTGNYIQYPVINYNGKEYEKESMCVHNRITLLYSGN